VATADDPSVFDTAWAELPLSPRHAELLADAAIAPDIAKDAGVTTISSEEELPDPFTRYGESAVPAILFRWHGPAGEILPQLRPDEPIDGAKYLFPGGSTPLINVHPAMRERMMRSADPVIVVEGTKQYLAAVSVLDVDMPCAVGISGCYGWCHNGGQPVPSFRAVPWIGRTVYVCFDADVSTNRDVWSAAEALSGQLSLHGAAEVRFITVPGAGTQGLDDVLAAVPDRKLAMRALVDHATEKLPRKPAKTKGTFFGDNGLLVARLADAVRDQVPVALARDQTIATYRGGVYQVNKVAYSSVVSEMLIDDYRRGHHLDVESFEIGRLFAEDRTLPERMPGPVLNVRNGLLDLATGELRDHDPEWLSSTQLPIAWAPDATCPTYDQWVLDVIPDQIEDLEEVTSTMLDPSSTPPKAAFLFGPSRSGKSTFIRLAEAMVGPAMVSGVTLQQLSTDRFASANVYSKMLNAAADVPASHIDDVSAFKMLTGEDLIQANRKYGHQFTFVNQALFMFSANELPTVSEASRAYLERMKPFRFDRSFAGHEDPSIEARMMVELPGILVRWVAGYRRLRARGGYAPTTPDVQGEFEAQSNRVRMWVAEEMEIVTESAGGSGAGSSAGKNAELRAVLPGSEMPAAEASRLTDLHATFQAWASESALGNMGKKLFKGHLTSINGVVEVRILPSRSRGFNMIRRPAGWDDDPDPGRTGRFSTPSPCHPAQSGDSEWPSQSSQGESAKNLPVLPGPVGTLVFDLETADADELWTYGPGFVRLAGYSADGQAVATTTDPAEIVELVERSGTIVGHGVWTFDLLALAHHHGLNITPLIIGDRVVDTLLTAFLDDPPLKGFSERQFDKAYDLDAVGHRVVGVTKNGDVRKMAKAHGGFDQIPLDDIGFVNYVKGDVEVAAKLHEALTLTDYARREHRLAGIAALMTLGGFRVDVELLERRVEKGRTRREKALRILADAYGLPTTKKDGKPCAAPLATEEGRAAIAKAFTDFGVAELPRTAKGNTAFGKDALDGLIERYADDPRIVATARAVKMVNGERSVYQTVQDHLVGDRVHPTIKMRQASGRWSVTRPGLTVMGKRGGRHVEREVFLPEPGHVLISADLSQIDARAIAVHSQDEAYLAMFQPGVDLHAEVAELVWGDRARREDAKALSHGIPYGMGPAKMAQTAGVELPEAERFLATLRERFPRLFVWRAEVVERAKAGELLDNGFGRKMRVAPEAAYTEGPALMGQGTARDLLMEGLVRLPDWMWSFLRAVVHDEIVLSVPVEDVDEIERDVLEALTFEWAPPGASIPVPVVAGLAARGANWGAVYQKKESV
jgi:P4 family phage/plasmid primase-like protien